MVNEVPTAVVIDTNVLVTANNKSDHAGLDCLLTCVNALEEAKKHSVVTIDNGMLILDEYRRHASLGGQPGVGDAFLKWLWQNQGNPRHCEQVTITPTGCDKRDFQEFPDDPALLGFDPSDRKFVAAALASRNLPTILNATDSDWWKFRQAFAANGLTIIFLCPDLFL